MIFLCRPGGSDCVSLSAFSLSVTHRVYRYCTEEATTIVSWRRRRRDGAAGGRDTYNNSWGHDEFQGHTKHTKPRALLFKREYYHTISPRHTRSPNLKKVIHQLSLRASTSESFMTLCARAGGEAGGRGILSNQTDWIFGWRSRSHVFHYQNVSSTVRAALFSVRPFICLRGFISCSVHNSNKADRPHFRCFLQARVLVVNRVLTAIFVPGH